MKDVETEFSVNGKRYNLMFNLNVLQAIQVEYGTFNNWISLVDGFVHDENGEKKVKLDSSGNPITEKVKDENGKEIEVNVYEKRETDIKALIFGLKEVINEAIDVANEEKNLNEPFLNERQVGRIITALGIANATNKMQEAIVNGTGIENSKNE